jgi:hypothetical protein
MDVANVFEVNWNCKTAVSVIAIQTVSNLLLCFCTTVFRLLADRSKYIIVNGALVHPSRTVQHFQSIRGIQYKRKRPLVTVQKEIKFPGRYHCRDIF